MLIYDIDKLNDNYYLLSRDNMTFLAYITKDKLVVNDISNIKIKKGFFLNPMPYFVYDSKIFSKYIYSNPKDTDNKSILWLNNKTSILGILLGIGIVIGIFLLVALIIFIIMLLG